MSPSLLAEPAPAPDLAPDLERSGAVGTASFRAMGSDAHVIVVGGPPHLIEWARARIDELEDRWSRFRPDSEICELNRRAGSPVTVSDDTLVLVQRAIDAFRLSGAAVDATVLHDVERAGYDRSFELLGADGDGVPAAPSRRPNRRSILLGPEDIVIAGNRVTLPAGTGFDPGGIGKGLAADLVATDLVAAGAGGALVNLGGDLRAMGTGPDDEPWTITIEAPDGPGPLERVGLAHGAVATSTTVRRRWIGPDGSPRHHLIDPGTGEPSTTDLVQVTVIAGHAWEAEALAKAVLLRGARHPFDLLGGTAAEALAITDVGRQLRTPMFDAYTGGR